jgi:large subunit ribosomal protein L30
MLKITLTKGLVGKTEVQKKVVRALGLRKFGSTVEHADTPTIRGMVRKVEHLLTVEKTEGEKKPAKTAEKRSTKKTATAAGAAK